MTAVRYSFNTEPWVKPLLEGARAARDLTPVHRDIGEELIRINNDRFMRSAGVAGPWPALSAATLLSRARGRSGKARVHTKKGALTARAQKVIAGAKPLIFSARLLRSMTYEALANYVDFGTNVKYAARQFFGWTETEPHTPARNPFGLTGLEERWILLIYERHLGRPFGVGG